MDSKAIELQIKNNLVKQAYLQKRSKFLREWRQRWVVLTVNYLFTFKAGQFREPTQVVDLRHIQSIKSYFKRSSEECCQNGFKITSDELTLYFKCKEVTEKWGWIVALERALDFKFSGETQYNHRTDLRSRGLDPQVDYGFVKPEVSNTDTIRRKSLSTQDASFNDKSQLYSEQLVRYRQLPARQSRMTSTSFIDVKFTTVETQTDTDERAAIAKKQPQKFSPTSKLRRVDYRENYQDDIGLRRSRMARSVFDQLKSQSPKVRRTIGEIINKLLVATDSALARFAILEIKAHEAKSVYIGLLVENDIKEICSQVSAIDALMVLRALSPDLNDLFSLEQLELIKSFIIRCLETFKKDSILMLAVEMFAMVHSVSEFKQDKLREVLRILHILLKTNKNAELLDFIKTIQF